MRILHIIPSVSPLRGGPSRSVMELCRGLAGVGCEVTLVTTDDNGLSRLKVPLDLPIDSEGLTIWYFRRQLRPYTVSFPLLRWVGQNVNRFDLVNIHAVFSHVSDFCSRIVRRVGKPYLIFPHGILMEWGLRNRRPRPKALFKHGLIGANIRAADCLVFATDVEREEAEKWVRFSRSEVIPFGVGSLKIGGSRKISVKEDGLCTLVFVARVDRIKNLELLLQSLALLRVLPIRLKIAGEGEEAYVNSLRRLAAQLGLQSSIDWIGWADDKARLEMLAHADIFVLPSSSESFSVATVEAMAAGLPVVISPHTGIAPLVDRAGAGIVAETTPEGFAAAIRELCLKPDLRREMGARGQRLVAEEFSREAVIRRFLALFGEIVAARGGATSEALVDGSASTQGG